jgi:hypothetical protein
MARLMVVPIRNRGDSVLVLSHRGGTAISGFVAQTTMAAFLRDKPSMCECVSFVKRNLERVEAILQQKQGNEPGGEQPSQCVEITEADLVRGGVSPPH